MAVPANLNIDQGGTYDFTLTWTDGGTPVDLTGYTAKMQARASHQGGDLYFTLTDADGITITPLTGLLTVEISDERTSLLVNPVAVYDLAVVSAAGKVKYLLKGKLLVSARSTEIA